MFLLLDPSSDPQVDNFGQQLLVTIEASPKKNDLVITLEVNASELHFGPFFRGTRLNHVWPIWLRFLAEYGRVEYS